MSDLSRFREAQDAPAGGGSVHDRALAELRAGRKVSHWMWFVFPQLAGVAEWHGGRSSDTARFYALADRREAERFLQHPVLGPRLLSAFEATMVSGETDAVRLMGGIDAIKLKSSATLFAGFTAATEICEKVLERFHSGARCKATEALLNR